MTARAKAVSLLLLGLVALGLSACGDEKGPEQADTPEQPPAGDPAGGAKGAAKAPPRHVVRQPLKTDAFTIVSQQQTIGVTRDAPRSFTATVAGKKYAMALDDAGKITFTVEGQAVATGKLKGDKAKLAAGDQPYLEAKLYPTKVKIRAGSETFWQFKTKEDNRIKVYLGDTELGKVKYYPDTKKVKVKDVKEATLAESRDLGCLTGAPGALLIQGLDEQKRHATLLLLLVLGR